MYSVLFRVFNLTLLYIWLQFWCASRIRFSCLFCCCCEGVYSVRIDADEGKVVVAGDVDPAKLVKKLKRGGKHAEIWQNQKGEMMYNHKYPINQNMMQLGGKDNNKSQNQKGQKEKGAGGVGQLAHFPNIKGIQDLKVPAKEQKSVKFNLPEDEFDASDDGFDESDDNFDEYDEEG